MAEVNKNISIITINVNQLNSPVKRHRISHYINHNKHELSKPQLKDKDCQTKHKHNPATYCF